MYGKSDGRWMLVYPQPDVAEDIPIVIGGTEDTVMYNGVLHTRHTFNSDGTAEFVKGGKFTLFMVGGGGPGGSANANGYECGGGGAGRVRLTSVSRDIGKYTITIGAGGAAGSNGTASVFDTIQTQGGRRGAHGGAAAPSNAGSCGGGAHNMTAGGVTTTPTDATTFANNGGTPTAASRGAGGGGAMQAGQNSGPGGAGIEFPAGYGVYYAGGGAGCVPGSTVAGGVGGGGRSINGQATGEAGAANTGGGGGAGTNTASSVGGAGGSGVVQILYPAVPQIHLTAAKAPGQVTLTWTEIPDAVEYQVDQDGVRSWHAGSPLVVSGLTDGVQHTWKVRAFLPSGQFSAWSNPVTESSGEPWNEASGGTETTVSDYNGTGETWRVHTFTSSGTLTVNRATQPFRVLLVAGGGGGTNGAGNTAQNFAGGYGGAGGMLEHMDATFSTGDIAVTVGDGGGVGGQGGASSIGALPAVTGGGAGNGGSGGSGGGGGGWRPGTDSGHPPGWYGINQTGGSGIAGEGTSGQSTDNSGAGGLGGGAGGLNTGRASTITGTSVTYAPGAYGSGGNNGAPASPSASGGEKGVVIVAYRIA